MDDDQLLEAVLGRLRTDLGLPVMLIGAHARDHVTRGLGPLPHPPRATHDVDIAVAVDDSTDLAARLNAVGPSMGTYLRRRVLDVPVDILPCGAVDGSVTFSHQGMTWDLTGMREAWDTAGLVVRHDVTYRVPTLPAMTMLKLVAWDVRHAPGRLDRDAYDLSTLMDAAHRGHHEDAVYSDERCERYEWDPPMAGPYRQGLVICEISSPRTRSRLLDILADPTRIASQMDPRRQPSRVEQLEALRSGILGDA